ncbi:ATP synthase F1 subunit gamma [Pedobacter sp.]|nr:ATP synthase F1 subunit gamma [Candidatus Saccharibacteria bacterium]
MSSTRHIKSRIRSVKSNKQITKAMEMVAASKLRRAQDATIQTRHYANSALELLNALSGLTDVKESEFFHVRAIKTRLYILITSDRGLAGAYNGNALKVFSEQVKKDHSDGIKTRVICVGRKGAQYAVRLKDVEIDGVYEIPENVEAVHIRPILFAVVDFYQKKMVDAVSIVTTHFVNSFTQTAVLSPMLPAGFAEVAVPRTVSSAIFEPSVEEVLEYASVRLIEAQLYQSVLEATASEHAMRRAAMKNASDNATDIIDDLTLEMNKVRQASITNELSEISAGVEAMK